MNSFPVTLFMSKGVHFTTIQDFVHFQIQNDVANGHGDANHSHITQNFNHLTEELQQCKVVYRPAVNSSDNGNWTGNVHIQECTTWEYETNQFSETIVSKVNTLYCYM